MVKRILVIIFLFTALIGTVVFEQIYTDSAIENLMTEASELQIAIDENNLEKSTWHVTKIKHFWEQKEIAISLFVDYRDIEQISKQINLVSSHLENSDFELAKVECNLLLHITKTFKNQVSFDWQNII